MEKVQSGLLWKRKQLLKELKIIDAEVTRDYPSGDLQNSINEMLGKDIKGLEDDIVRVKLCNAELRQKNEVLEDSIEHWQQEYTKRQTNLENLRKELERYTDYRNSIQKRISRHSATLNNTISANTSFSNANTGQVLNSSIITDRISSSRSSNNSMMMD